MKSCAAVMCLLLSLVLSVNGGPGSPSIPPFGRAAPKRVYYDTFPSRPSGMISAWTIVTIVTNELSETFSTRDFEEMVLKWTGIRTNEAAPFLRKKNGIAGADLRVAVGMPRDKALTVIKANSGKDITPGLAIVGPNGEHPLHGFVWELEDYGVVIEVSGKEKVEGLTYWTLDDFAVSKDHRAKSAKRITGLTIDPRAKQVMVETIKP